MGFTSFTLIAQVRTGVLAATNLGIPENSLRGLSI
jgi:hypothetical protein